MELREVYLGEMMKDNYEIIPVGIYQKQSVFYDKSSQKLLIRIDKKESSYSQSFLVMIILFMLPIVRWLNQYLFINILLFNTLILIFGTIAVFSVSRIYFKKLYREIELSDFYLSRESYGIFLHQEKRNSKIAMITIISLFLIVTISAILYLLTSIFLFLFVFVGLLFPFCLFLNTKTKERYIILNQLIKELENE
ncbi:hypothetical protein D065_08627 [Streptococcus mitis 13/39]|uniref:Tandem five-TM protein n=1 Tax=Streptococcus mitis 13/39 TaxID=1239793 RepID=R0NYI4_STRMT|nr:hypothetical protein D065_08627 [Streptococcus mitis 13/39]